MFWRLLKRLFRTYGEAKAARDRETAYAAFRAALKAGDTRSQHARWKAFNHATEAQLAVQARRSHPQMWRGR